jgi:hypothetical protein
MTVRLDNDSMNQPCSQAEDGNQKEDVGQFAKWIDLVSARFSK